MDYALLSRLVGLEHSPSLCCVSQWRGVGDAFVAGLKGEPRPEVDESCDCPCRRCKKGWCNMAGLPPLSPRQQKKARAAAEQRQREQAELRFSMEVEEPYPAEAEMALFNSNEERGTEWIPVSQETFPARPWKSRPFTASKVWIRVGDDLLHSRSCFITTVPGRPITVKFPPTSWAEYVKRNGLPEEWATDE